MEDPIRSSLEKIAVQQAKTAATLSPNSLEYAHFLLFEFSQEQVVQESIRALAIKDPTDPTIDDLSNQNPQISPQASNDALRHSLQCLLTQCVNFHGNRAKMWISENPLGHKNLVLYNIKKFVRTPKDQPLEKEIEERLACNRSLQRGNNSETPTGDDLVSDVDLESGPVALEGEDTSKTPFLTTGGRSRSRI
ncbi:hypothetical protein FRX31_028246, partial [Thalictrum thalictroides]